MTRLTVRKTYKLYIGGAFPRTESGRYDIVHDPGSGDSLANVCRASRKDVRNACEAARAAFGGWSGRAAMNRGQILYRIAEMLEGRSAEFVDLLAKSGVREPQGELEATVDRLVHFAGFADKVTALLGTVNPVPGPYFNFSMPEATGVVGIVCPDEAPLLALASLVAPAIVTGNTTVVVVSEKTPLTGIAFAEVLHVSDLPGGVVNLLSGRRSELAPVLASHRDVNALVLGVEDDSLGSLEAAGADNVKRIARAGAPDGDWTSEEHEGLSAIERTLEIKTVWHTMGV